MKKSIKSIAMVMACGLLASCGGAGTTGTAANGTQTNAGNGSILGAIASNIIANQTGVNGQTVQNAGSLLSNIISTFGSGITTNQSSLIGTWSYQKPCIQFESESLLAKAGGALVANKVEDKLATYYQKIGVKPGACKFVFTNDNKVQYTIGGKTYEGTYRFDSSKKQVTITSALGTNITAYVSISGNTMGLTFDASKLLSLLNGVSSLSSQLSTISSISKSYTGMKAGFEFVK